MTDEQMRVAIAEACGWILLPSGYWLSPRKTKESPRGELFNGPLDYLNDLNAMREAEKTLYGMQTHSYALKLGPCEIPFSVAHASARQRAEAFLRTLGKWD